MIATFYRAFFLVAGFALSVPGSIRAEASAQRHLEMTGSHTLRLIYDCSFTWPAGSNESAVFHLPVPPETGTQHIVRFSSTLHGQTETDDGNPSHRLLSGTLHHDRGGERREHWQIEITGEFRTWQLMDGPPSSSTMINAPGGGEYLDSTESINWKSPAFQEWLDSSGLRRQGGETAVHFGSRVYAYFLAHGRYTYPPETAWNAAAVARHLRSDCGGFSLVFTAACRANHIPARLLVGQCFKARKSGGTVELTGERQAHVIAEFFDPHIGWIPEDISSTFLKVPGYGDLNFFGRTPGYFFAWHTDTDFYFDTPRKPNAHLQWIQNPSLWFSENADGANDTASHHWTVETID